jgi:hypothetical protein
MRKALLLRGAIELLSNARKHICQGQKTNEWTDGSYCNNAIEAADNLIQFKIWQLEFDFRKLNENPKRKQ